MCVQGKMLVCGEHWMVGGGLDRGRRLDSGR